MMPLDFPHLQHLALELGSEHEKRRNWQTHFESLPSNQNVKRPEDLVHAIL